ncbi:MAG: succinate dehydrogenase/fumarate reductase iron-sulfur subunit, partial [Nitrospinota bacterium]
LVVDMGPFFEKYRKVMPFVLPTEEAQREPARFPPDSKERRKVDPHIECITCGACHAACSLVRWDPQFLGPAALNRAATLLADSRDGAGEERLRAVADEHGVWRCHSQFNCTEVCPMGLNPTEAIAALKRRAAGRGIREFASRLVGRGAALAAG